jgi:hypothetical protein
MNAEQAKQTARKLRAAGYLSRVVQNEAGEYDVLVQFLPSGIEARVDPRTDPATEEE